MYFLRCFPVSLILAAHLLGCGGGDSNADMGVLSFHATSIEEDNHVRSVTFGISRILMSETGEEWTVVSQDIDGITIESDAMLDLEEADLPIGEYHGVKVELKSGNTFALLDGTTVDMDYPDILLYKQGGMYRYSNSDNGFPDTNEYFLFTTRNGMLSSAIEVEPDERSFLVLSFRPMFLSSPDSEDDVGLAAKISYTSFLY